MSRLARLDELLVKLEEAREAGPGAYSRDEDLRLRTERALELALQICIDVGAHVVAERRLRTPTEYGDVFTSLAEAKMIDAELGERLRSAAGLRNILVHGYMELDSARVQAALEHLDDLRSFAAAMQRLADEPAG